MPKKRRILATRKLKLVDKYTGCPQDVSVVMYCPEILPNHGGFECAYQIKGFGNYPVKRGCGDDPIQAILLTLAKIGIDLYKSSESMEGRIRWRGDVNLGFPVFEAMEKFIPEPKTTMVL